MKTLSQFLELSYESTRFSKRLFVSHQAINRVANVPRYSVNTDCAYSNVIALDVRSSEVVLTRCQKETGICERMIDHINAISQIAISRIWDLALRCV